MDLFGIGPACAARILVDVGDVTRFPDRGHFASWTGTAPLEASSGDVQRHRGAPGREPALQPRPAPRRRRPAPPRHRRPGLLPAQARRGQGRPRGAALPTPADLRHRLPPAPRRRRPHRSRPGRRPSGSGKTRRGDYEGQRGRPDPGHRHFGPVTSRTRTGHARPGPRERESMRWPRGVAMLLQQFSLGVVRRPAPGTMEPAPPRWVCFRKVSSSPAASGSCRIVA
jgi:hypothetical protein